MVPGSTLMYGSSFIRVTLRPRASRMAASDAAAMPLPSEDTTPPVTKIRGVMPDDPQEMRILAGRRDAGERSTHRRRDGDPPWHVSATAPYSRIDPCLELRAMPANSKNRAPRPHATAADLLRQRLQGLPPAARRLLEEAGRA